MALISTVYDVATVNTILDMVYTAGTMPSAYSIPTSKDDPMRIAFDSWLDGMGFTDKDVYDVNYATASLRIYYLSLFDCNNGCLCIPPMLLNMGFGTNVSKNQVFNYEVYSTCCSSYSTTDTITPANSRCC